MLVLLPSAFAAVSTYALYRRITSGSVDFEQRYEGGFIAGFHGSRYDITPGYRFTGRNAYLRLENLPRRGELLVQFRLSAPRPEGEHAPVVWFSADGRRLSADVTVGRRVTGYRLRVPLHSRGLTLQIHAETTFVTGLGPVGVRVHRVDFELPRARSVPATPLLWMAASALILLGACVVAGRSVLQACLIAVALSAGSVYLLARDSVPFQTYSRDVLLSSVLATVVCISLRFFLTRVRGLSRQEGAALSGILALGFLTSLLGIWHPLFLSSDAVFQANRLSEVLGGNFFTTSVTQHEPPFRIPYPVSLYVLAAPWVALGLDPVRTLQVLTAVFQSATAHGVALLAARYWKDPRAALIAAALYPSIPIVWLAMSAGNLTNLLGVSANLLFVACLLGLWGGSSSRRELFGVSFFSLVALTSHFSTALIASVLWPCWLWALFWKTPATRRELALAKRATGAVVGSAFLAMLYYVGYREVLESLWARLAVGTPLGADADAATPLTRLGEQVALGRAQLGNVLLLALVGGVVLLLARREKSALDLILAVWLAVSLFFLALDVTTPIGVRYLLQATPLVTLCAAGFLSWLMRRGRFGKLASRLALVCLVLAGLGNFLDGIVTRYH